MNWSLRFLFVLLVLSLAGLYFSTMTFSWPGGPQKCLEIPAHSGVLQTLDERWYYWDLSPETVGASPKVWMTHSRIVVDESGVKLPWNIPEG